MDHVALAEAKPLAAVVVAAKQSMPGESPTAIEAPPAQHREAAPPATPSAAATPERLAGDSSAQPPRISSGDVPAALLQQIVMLPKMTDSDAPEPLGRRVGFDDRPLASTRLKPVEHVERQSRADRPPRIRPTPAATTLPRPARPSAAEAFAAQNPIGSRRRRLPV